MRIFLLILLTLFLQTANVGAGEDSVSEFFNETFKDTQALLSDQPMDDRKTLVEVIGDAWRALWSR